MPIKTKDPSGRDTYDSDSTTISDVWRGVLTQWCLVLGSDFKSMDAHIDRQCPLKQHYPPCTCKCRSSAALLLPLLSTAYTLTKWGKRSGHSLKCKRSWNETHFKCYASFVLPVDMGVYVTKRRKHKQHTVVIIYLYHFFPKCWLWWWNGQEVVFLPRKLAEQIKLSQMSWC